MPLGRPKQPPDLARGYRIAAGVVVALAVASSAQRLWQAAVHGTWPNHSQDTYLYWYPNLAYLRDSLTRGYGLLWNGLQNCGQPAFANPQSGALYPTSWLLLVVAPPLALVLVNLFHFVLGPLGVLALARVFRLHPVAALTGAIALMTADRTAVLSLWQPSGFIAHMWMPWALAATEYALRRPRASTAVLLGLALTLQLLAGSPQLSLFTYEVIALRCLWELGTRWRAWRGVLAVAAGAVLPAGLAAAMLLPAIDLTRLSVRGVSLDTGDLLDGGLTPTWAEFRTRVGQPLSDSAICAPWFFGLASLAVFAPRRRRVAVFYLLAAALFLALSFDGPVFALYRALPFGELFRHPARFRQVTAVLATILVAFGAHAFLCAWQRESWRRWLLVCAPLLGVAAFGWLTRSLNLFAAGYVSVLVAIGILGAVRGPAHRRRWRHGVAIWAVGLPILFLGAQVALTVSAPAPPTGTRAASLLARAPALRALAATLPLQDRVYVFRGAEAVRAEDWSVAPKSSSLFGLRGVSDYEPQVSPRLADLVLRLRGQGPYEGFAAFERTPEAPRNRPLLNLVAARYVVGNSQAPPVLDGGPLREMQRDGSFVILENPAALPRAFYVPAAEVVADPAALLGRLAAADHDPRRVALIEAPPADGFLGSPDSGGTAAIESDRGEELRVRVHGDQPGFVFVSDQDYPGWTAMVNDVATPILRANYAFRLVRVPAGESTVVFRYQPRAVWWGAAISMATLLFVVAVLVIGRVHR